MPLRARLNGEDIQAFAVSRDGWEALKGSYRDQQLIMPCCEHRAIPKTSKLGSHFFAHARRGTCSSAPETKEHLLAKSIIARAAMEAGWKVTTECPGTAPDGSTWIADILAERRNTRIALEVQWSKQSMQAFHDRQERYKRSGVRGAWFVKAPRHTPYWDDDSSTFELPLFRIRIDEEATGFSVTDFGVDLATFTKGMLRGGLYWGPKAGDELELRGVIVTENCWRCYYETSVLLGIELHHPQCGLVETASFTEEGVAETLQQVLSPKILAEHRLGALKRRFSRTVGESYLSRGCVRCDALLGDFPLMELKMELVSAGALPDAIPIANVVLTERHAECFAATWHYGAPAGTEGQESSSTSGS